MTELELLDDQYKYLDRLGPGSNTETEKAFTLTGLRKDQKLTVLDIGCGTGSQTLTLARILNGHITATDLFSEFLEKVDKKASQLDLSNNITTTVCSMKNLPFEEDAFDLIWSEGAIYNMGFENGVKAWRRYLKPDGVLAVSEATWIKEARPKELEDFWKKEYPGIETVSSKLKVLENNGYSPVAHFILPSYCWMDNYYFPLEDSYSEFLARHDHEPAALDIVEGEKREIEIYEKYKEFYSYGFYIARKT